MCSDSLRMLPLWNIFHFMFTLLSMYLFSNSVSGCCPYCCLPLAYMTLYWILFCLLLTALGLSVNDQDALCGNELVSSSVGARDSIYKELLVEVSCISCQASKQDFKKKNSWSKIVPQHPKCSVGRGGNFVGCLLSLMYLLPLSICIWGKFYIGTFLQSSVLDLSVKHVIRWQEPVFYFRLLPCLFIVSVSNHE